MAEINSKFTEQEVLQHAATLKSFKSLMGIKICCVKSDNLDLRYKEKKMSGEMCTLKPIKKYFTESFMITGIALDKLSNGKPVIVFNNSQQLTFPLTKEPNAIVVATRDDVNNAIREWEEEGKVKFFSDLSLVNEVVEQLNETNRQDLIKFSEELINQAMSLETLNKTEKTNLDNYMKVMNNL